MNNLENNTKIDELNALLEKETLKRRQLEHICNGLEVEFITASTGEVFAYRSNKLVRKEKECEQLKEQLNNVNNMLKNICLRCVKLSKDKYKKALDNIEVEFNKYLSHILTRRMTSTECNFVDKIIININRVKQK